MPDWLFAVIVGWLHFVGEHQSDVVFRQIVLCGLLLIALDVVDACEPIVPGERAVD
jgi:hypothetical protein